MARVPKQLPYGETRERTKQLAYGSSNRKALRLLHLNVAELPLSEKNRWRAVYSSIQKLTPSNVLGDKVEKIAKGPVQGQRASDLERLVYQVLIQDLGWSDENIDFQSPILGGRSPGGQILDFVLYGPGVVHVINVNGEYWHGFGTDFQKTQFNEAAVSRVMPSARIHSLYTADLLTREMARRKLLELIGRGI